MLIEDFYFIDSIKTEAGNHLSASVRINKDHNIFKGHFPGDPVTPGVCLIQIIKELTQKLTGVILRLKTTKNVKFMSIINPELDPNLEISIEMENTAEDFLVKSVILNGDTVSVKFSGIFQTAA